MTQSIGSDETTSVGKAAGGFSVLIRKDLRSLQSQRKKSKRGHRAILRQLKFLSTTFRGSIPGELQPAEWFVQRTGGAASPLLTYFSLCEYPGIDITARMTKQSA